MPWAKLSDVRLFYELRGKGEPVLLIPGLGSTHIVWAPLVERLARDFCLITPDNRGVGDSTAVRRPRHLSHYSADLIELLDHLQLPRAHVVGLSLGGIIAQRLAMDHGDRVNRLVLISCSHRFGPYLRQMMHLIGQTLRHLPAQQFARAMSILSVSPSLLDQDPGRIDRQLADPRKPVPKSALIEQLRCLAASDPAESEFRIISPTLVVAGQFDSLIPHCYAKQMADAIPGSQFKLLPGIGHNPIDECPDAVATLLHDFLHNRPPAPGLTPNDTSTPTNRERSNPTHPAPVSSRVA